MSNASKKLFKTIGKRHQDILEPSETTTNQIQIEGSSSMFEEPAVDIVAELNITIEKAIDHAKKRMKVESPNQYEK